MRAITVVGMLSSVALLLSGCGKDGESAGKGAEAKAAGGCEQLLEKLKECSDEQPTDKEEAEFLQKCEKSQDSERFKAMMECSSEATCNGFKQCQKKKREAARLAEDLQELKDKPADGKYRCKTLLEEEETKNNEEVKAACANVFKVVAEKEVADIKKEFESGKVSQAINSCKFQLKDDVIGQHEVLTTYCKQLPKDALTALTKTVTEVRDAGKKVDFNDCYSLEKAAEAIGEAEVKAAKLLCREARTAKDIVAAIEKTKEEMKTDKPSIPYACESRVKDLQKLDTEWSKKQLETLGRACYHDLGKYFLAKRTAEKYCGLYDKKVLAGLEKHPTDDAELKALADAVKSGRCNGKL